MARSDPTGTRIRSRRLDLGIKQAALAKACEISPSYLNLIEHNRRKIGGALLARLARALDTDPAKLSEGADRALTDTLHSTAAAYRAVAAEVERADEFAGRFPGWASVIAAQDQRIKRLERLVETLNDRLTHDPILGAAMHDVLSTATAIRSTAGILADDAQVDPEWQARFHRNLYEDSQRLAEAAGSLVGYLDAADGADPAAALAPLEELEGWLDAQDWRIGVLDRAMPPTVDSLLDGARDIIRSEAGRRLARRWLTRYAEEARRIPVADLERLLAEGVPDPAAVSRRFGVDLATALRRIGHVADAGLVACDGSGTIIFRKPVDGFDVPRFGSACPLWPLYDALHRPMSPIRALVDMPGAAPRRYLAFAISTPGHPEGFDGPSVIEATMLLLPFPRNESETALPIGSTCRICPRDSCAARREPSILGQGL